MAISPSLQAALNISKLEYQDAKKIVVDIPECLSQLQKTNLDTHVLVDFDETLLLRNSTEEYLDTLQPKVLGVYFLTLLDYLKPWNWLPSRLRGEVLRDWVRVLSATILFPWTLLLWPGHAKKVAQSQQNRALVNALSDNPNLKVLVTTDGFSPIVAPILRHLELVDVELYACRLWWGSVDRLNGKYNRLKKTLGIDVISNSIVITDSPNDIKLLQAARQPYLIQWPQSKYAQAMASAYAPFLYLVKFKHNLKYLLNGILMDQWMILVLASSWVAPHPILHATGLLFLIASFWCIYELGYYENDYIAERYEKHPNLRETKLTRPEAPVIQPWIWASVLSAPGFLLLQWAMMSELSFTMNSRILEKILWMAPCWFAILLVTRFIYFAFNHVDKRTRVWLYLLLQYSRLPAFATLSVVSPVGTILLSAQTLISWIRYIVYRYQGNMREVPHAILRFVTLGFLMMMLAMSNGVTAILNWQMAAILGFCLVRTLSTLPQLVSQMRWISDDDWTPSDFSEESMMRGKTLADSQGPLEPSEDSSQKLAYPLQESRSS